MLIDFNQTRTEFQLLDGQVEFQHHFQISSNPGPMQPNNPLTPGAPRQGR